MNVYILIFFARRDFFVVVGLIQISCCFMMAEVMRRWTMGQLEWLGGTKRWKSLDWWSSKQVVIHQQSTCMREVPFLILWWSLSKGEMFVFTLPKTNTKRSVKIGTVFFCTVLHFSLYSVLSVIVYTITYMWSLFSNGKDSLCSLLFFFRGEQLLVWESLCVKSTEENIILEAH